MGVDVDAKLMYGLHYDDLKETLSEEEMEQLVEDCAYEKRGLVTCSPHYDSEPRYWYFGLEFSPSDIDDDDARQKVKNEFFNIFGLEGEFIVSPHVT